MNALSPGNGDRGPRWEHFSHKADIGVRGFGPDLERAFEQTALAMTAVVTAPENVRNDRKISLRCQAPDRELLLADWLNALVYEMASRQMLFGKFAVSISDHTLSADAWGEPVDRARHQPTVEIKGATYTELRVGRSPGGQEWYAQAVLDV